MLFKKNDEAKELKQEIKAKKAEIAEARKLHQDWIKMFMDEMNPNLAVAQMAVIDYQAKRIAQAEVNLTLLKKHYKLIKRLF